MISVFPTVNISVLERTDHYVIATFRQLMLHIWYGGATAIGIERSQVLFDEWVKSEPAGGAFLLVFASRRPAAPNEEAKAAMDRTARLQTDKLRGIGTLFEAEGFIAATIRSVMMRINALGGRHGSATFRDVEAAAAWAAETLSDPTITASALARAIREAKDLPVEYEKRA